MTTPKVKLKKLSDAPAPEHFTKPVDIVLLGGEIAEVDVVFIYRDRNQFAELIDEKLAAEKAAEDAAVAAAKVAQAAAKDAGGEGAHAPVKTVAEWYKETDQAAAKFVLKIASGWDLDDPFTEKSLLDLERRNPGALQAIATKYRQSVAEIRVKN